MSIQLRENEIMHKEAHFHWSVYLLPGIWAFIWLIVFISILKSISSFDAAQFFKSLSIISAIAFSPALYIWIKNKSKTYMVTNQRLYVEEGIFSKVKRDIPFNKINDIFTKQSLWQRILGSGNLSVLTGNDVPIFLKNLDYPEQFHEALSKVCNRN